MSQQGLFTDPWPHFEQFPLNENGRNVHSLIKKEAEFSRHFLVMTGFTSLEYLIDFFNSLKISPSQQFEIVLGFEPLATTRRENWGTKPLPTLLKEYWLERKISILKCGAVVKVIDLIEQGRITFFIQDRLHAKIYLGDHHAILGSSNFTYGGLVQRREANVRYPKDSAEYHEIRTITTQFHQDSRPFNAEILQLLNNLLTKVGWREALARAIRELADGRWMDKYPEAFRLLGKVKLWPSQRIAIGQALAILDNQGSVLVADPTGSGKTRLNAALQLAIINRQWKRLHAEHLRTVVICPPSVKDGWEKEYNQLRFDNFRLISHGDLSRQDLDGYDNAVDAIRDANILLIDEAHNFLNNKSVRSTTIRESRADQVVLATATPINKRAEDLLRLIELLDVDNLSDKDLVEYKKLRKKRSLLSESEKNQLRSYIGHFTVRRTKKDLNSLIEKSPNHYRNALGNPCKYPAHADAIYATGETEKDQEIARHILELSSQLKGIINLERFQMAPGLKGKKERQQEIIDQRLMVAAPLARYHIRSFLRSSRPAAIQHIYGTDTALQLYPFEHKAGGSGDMVGKLRKMRAKLPKSNFEVPMPDWLRDLALFQQACDQEIGLYIAIGDLIQQLSDQREMTKAKLMGELFETHPLVLAFDSSLISLDYFRHLLEIHFPKVSPLVVTGATATNKKTAKKWFGLGSEERNRIALCSDAMSEGVNLQQASAMVFLDMPGVMRIAEQRIGRLDRMDSPHEVISIHWPHDSAAFALKKDERLIYMNEYVRDVLGSNIEIPTELKKQKSSQSVDTQKEIEAYRKDEKEDKEWKGIQNAFKPVLDLVGNEGVISQREYDALESVSAAVHARVSLVPAHQPWAFFAIKESDERAPRWILIEGDRKLTMDLQAIAKKLRKYLQDAEDLAWDDSAIQSLSRFYHDLHKNEIDTLPNKKRRALKMMQTLLSHYRTKETPYTERDLALRGLLNAFQVSEEKDHDIDFYLLADKWLRILQPFLTEKRKTAKGNQVVDLSLIAQELKKRPLEDEPLKDLFGDLPVIERLDKRVAACIVGVGKIDKG